MYSSFRSLCERLLRIPGDPGAPPGDESSTRVFRASPNYFKYLVLLWGMKTVGVLLPMIILMILFLAVSTAVRNQTPNGTAVVLGVSSIVVFLFLLQRLFRLALLRLDYEKRWYVVTDRSLRVREGVVAVQEMTVTFANIQNISISQGPIQRLLQVADLKVDTAGGGGTMQHTTHGHDLHTAWFRGIDNANEVRELIQQRLRRLKDSGLGDHEELVQSPTTNHPNLLEAFRGVYREAAALRMTLERGPKA